MNFRSELIAPYHVSSTFAFHCHALFWLLCLLCIYCFFPPPLLSSVAPAATADYTAAAHDYVVNDSAPTVELPGKQCPSPLPHTAYMSILYLFALGIAAVTCLPIQLHSLSLSPP